MPLLLVDDRDGRIVAELQTQDDDVQRVLEAWTGDAAELPDYLCIVEVQTRPGAIIGTESTVKVRPIL